jgi:hypothetical protein
MEYKTAILAREILEIKERNDKIIAKLNDKTIEVEFKTIDNENKRCLQKRFENDGSGLIDKLKSVAIKHYNDHNKELASELEKL